LKWRPFGELEEGIILKVTKWLHFDMETIWRTERNYTGSDQIVAFRYFDNLEFISRQEGPNGEV
jgi:hypothetical protein